jgi:hypothetical protein
MTADAILAEIARAERRIRRRGYRPVCVTLNFDAAIRLFDEYPKSIGGIPVRLTFEDDAPPWAMTITPEDPE